MSLYHRFLLVDDVAENRLLISRSLFKQYPNAVVCECQDAATASAYAALDGVSLAVVHRTHEHDGPTLVAFIRKGNPALPVVLLSGRLPTPLAAEIGADAVVGWDSWQGIVAVVARQIALKAARSVPA